MIYAERGNKVRQISENDIPKYVEQGYKIVDEKGTVLRDTVPTDVATLKLAYKQHTQQIAALKAENAKLKAQLEESNPKTVAKETKAVAEESIEMPTEVADKEPKKSRKTKADNE